MKIAVVGSGISGLSAAWLLSKEHEVVLFEKDGELGGHAHTVLVPTGKGEIAVDTGFMVFNPPQYPNLVNFFKILGVGSVATSMRFSLSMHDGGFEWNSDMPGGIFVDKRNFFRPSFWFFLFGILRFNKIARRELVTGISENETLEEFLVRHHVSETVRTKYIYPLAGAIWSTPVMGTKLSPALAILAFLNNHHLLNVADSGGFQWQTVVGGSKTYVKKVEQELQARGVDIRLNTPVEHVVRKEGGITVRAGGIDDVFDFVVMATHADLSLKLLVDADQTERDILSTFSYERNEVLLHGDISCMPHRRRAWAAWNYLGEMRGADGLEKVSLTYHMNELQHIDPSLPLFVTLNPHHDLDPKLIYGKFIYHHPIYTPASIKAQSNLSLIQNKRRTLFCGSYFGHGFHEDGITSAIDAVKYLDIKVPWAQ